MRFSGTRCLNFGLRPGAHVRFLFTGSGTAITDLALLLARGFCS